MLLLLFIFKKEHHTNWETMGHPSVDHQRSPFLSDQNSTQLVHRQGAELA
jgi:hypothetical protein